MVTEKRIGPGKVVKGIIEVGEKTLHLADSQQARIIPAPRMKRRKGRRKRVADNVALLPLHQKNHPPIVTHQLQTVMMPDHEPPAEVTQVGIVVVQVHNSQRCLTFLVNLSNGSHSSCNFEQQHVKTNGVRGRNVTNYWPVSEARL